MEATELLRAAATTLPLALAYNPMAAVFAAPVAAALLGVKNRSTDRVIWGVCVVAFAWLVGDGLRVIARARDVYDGAGHLVTGVAPWAELAAIALWGVAALALGYVLPVWTGVFVGRRVTHGTGWAAAASIAVGASLAVSALAGGLGG